MVFGVGKQRVGLGLGLISFWGLFSRKALVLVSKVASKDGFWGRKIESRSRFDVVLNTFQPQSTRFGIKGGI